MMNLHFVENQPRWRVAIVARFARLIGVLIHVEGIPFGSSRNYSQRGESAGSQGASVSLHEGPPAT